MSLYSSFTLLAALAGVLVCFQAAPDPAWAQLSNTAWPKFHGDLGNAAQSGRLGPTAASIKWAYDGWDKILASPAIGTNGDIYIGLGWKICAINSTNGLSKWCKLMHADVSQSSPAVAADGTIVVGDRSNILTAINPDGTTKWELIQSREGDIRSSPTIAPDGTIYFGYTGLSGSFGVVTAVKPEDGTVKWQYVTGSPIYSSPALAPDGSIYIASRDGVLHSFLPDGTRAWKFDTAGGITTFSSPAIGADGTIYLGTATGLVAVNPDGTLKWYCPTGGSSEDSSPAIATDGTIYVGSKVAKQKTLFAVKPDGNVKWKLGPYLVEQDLSTAQAIGADGIVYVSMGKIVYALNPDGSVLWQQALGNSIPSSPAIGGTALLGVPGEGVLYVGSRDTSLYAFATPRSGGPVNHNPVANAGPDQTVQVGQLATFDGSQSFDPDGTAPTSYDWNFGDSQTGNGAIVSHAFASPGIYTVTLTVNDGLLTGTDTVSVIVNPVGGSLSFQDSFDREDSPSLGNGWTEAAGDLIIQGQEMRNAALNGFHVAVRASLVLVNQEAEGDFASVNNNASTRLGVVLRYQSPGNYYALYRRTGGTTALRISRFSNGEETVLGSLAVPQPVVNSLFHLKGSIVGSTLTLTLNGTTTLSASDSTFASGAPGAFIYTLLSSTPSHRVDNFSATPK